MSVWAILGYALLGLLGIVLVLFLVACVAGSYIAFRDQNEPRVEHWKSCHDVRRERRKK